MIDVPNARGWLRIKRPGEQWTPWMGNAFTENMKRSLVRHWTDLSSGSLPYKLGKAGGSQPTKLDVRDATAQLGSMPLTVDAGYPVYVDFKLTYVWTVTAGVGTGDWANVYVVTSLGARMSAFENQTLWGTKGAGEQWVVQYKMEVI